VSSRQFFLEAVEEGLEKRHLKTYPAVSIYLVNLLEHYLDARNLFESEVDEQGRRRADTLAEMYLQANNSESSARRELLKKLADKSLYISGFFGDSLSRKLVDIDYYAELGGSAYGCLSACVKEDTTAMVYKVFSSRFLEFVDVLTYISQKSNIHSDQSLLRLYDRYLKTGSEVAKEKLIEMGVVTIPRDQIKSAKQD
jgi:hypothetical protein